MERDLRRRGYRLLAGVDEAGCGPLAGPVVAAAVLHDRPLGIPGLRDSKQLSAGRREALATRIREEALSWALGVATVEEIDALRIRDAARLAQLRAVAALPHPPQLVLVDGPWRLPLDLPQRPVVDGDARVALIAAASILAKVERDRLMRELDALYPGYGFARHKGYLTREHLQALARLGPCPAHRRSFRPLRG
ncbi:MAG: ribonuclease HII [Armatimonadota bacterium]|nr:ribonuclease HII [Armatimonadota bacterium]MDR7439879.1 ribonuclease HII [Armatimonadota bacterium]MDR7563326.1 ribonuclease HII [Armatimonadota bacterium]MDR7567480.1 ribonuclease HII [Armatimonadota bacterium]MDR7601971.1 ribonuclease HII [Armatimonadota bacterium]